MAIARAAAGDDDTATRHARVEAMLRDHRATLLWIARRWSGSAEDADDALQRAMEIYVRRLETIDAATEFAWLKVVVRHEAMALRRARLQGVPLEADDLAERIAAPDVAVQERIEREERNAQSREAMARLKPDERTALLLKAEGYSYREIGERQGWTYTKVNRAITEGRRRFLKVFASIEAGDECERFAPTLLALVQGRAEPAAVVELRPHLRHCATCRATVRELHASPRHRLALHLPFVAGIAPVRWLGDRIEGGGAADGRWPDVKGVAHSVVQRMMGGDAATSMQLASSGGGRGPAVAVLLGLCLSGGAGTYCVATGVFPDPVRIVRHAGGASQHRQDERAPARRKAESRAATPTPTPIPATVALRDPVVAATPSPSERGEPDPRREPKRADRADPAAEFGFEGTTGSPGASGAGASGASPEVATAATAGSSSGASSGGQSSPSNGGSTPSSSPAPTSGGEFMP